MDEDEFSVERICRTCLSTSTGPLELLWNDEEESNYARMMIVAFGKILPDAEDIQHRICGECEDIIRKAFQFKQKVRIANETLLGFDDSPSKDKNTQTDAIRINRLKAEGSARSDVVQFDDENFDSINLQEDCIFDGQLNPLLELNAAASASSPAKVKREQGELSDDDYESGNGEDDDQALVEIKEENDEDLVCELNPFSGGDDSQDRSEKLRVHKCGQCSKIFSRGTHLKRHELIHEEGKLQCKICEKRFTRLDHLNLHVASNHSETKPFQCVVAECKKGFVRQEQLKRHIEAKHSEAAKQKECCGICQKTFTSKKYLRMHMKSCNGNGNGLACKYCGKDCSDKNELNDHMSKEHQNEKPYLCSECGLRFVRNDYLVIHMRRHLGVKPYKCRFCDKGFPRATDLTVHERYHTNEKTHLCNLCGKGFQRAYNLLVHMRVHTGEKPYQCSFCNKSFSQGNDLKAHIRRHTGERFKCEICNEGFIQGYHLTHHKRTVHGLDVKSHIRRVEKFVAPTTSGQDLSEEQIIEEEEVDEVKMEADFQYTTN